MGRASLLEELAGELWRRVLELPSVVAEVDC
jgi:hypothetical protein